MISKTILITGATGSLGAYLTRYYSRKGYRVLAHGRAAVPPPFLTDFAAYFSFDLNGEFELPACDVCIHTAALSDDKARLPDLLLANEAGTKKLIEKLNQDTKLIHISSSSVYLPEDMPIKEELAGNQQLSQLSPYGLSKWKSEEMIRKHANQKEIYILRPRAFYGAGDCVILPRILKLVKGTEQPFIQRPGKMDTAVSLTHYSTIAHAIDCCIQQEGTGIKTYNVADKTTYRLIDVVRSLTAKLYGKSLPEKEVPIAFLKLLSLFKIGGMTKLLVRSFTRNMVLDTGRIEKELGFSPEITFEMQLDELVHWINSNGGVERHKTGDKSLAWTADL